MVRLNPNHGLMQLHRIVGPSVQSAFAAALIDGILLKCRDVYCLVLVASVALTTICTAFCVVSSEYAASDDDENRTENRTRTIA